MDLLTSFEHRLRIGGLEFRLHSEEFSLAQEVDWAYRPFLAGGGAREAAGDADHVDVRFRLALSPRFDGTVVFQSEAHWTLRTNGAERAFVWQTPGSAEPTWVARFAPGAREVAVECGPGMVDGEGAGRVLRSPFRYPFDQILTMYALGPRGFVVHAAGLVFEGRGVVFPGVSGAGKSTIARLAAARPGWTPLSDDRIVLRRDGEAVRVHGSPWAGTGRVAAGGSAPGRALLFLEKGPEHAVRPISPAECLERLFPVISIPWFDAEALGAGLEAAEAIARSIPAGVLTFRPEAGAVEAVERYLATRAAVGGG